MDILKESTGKIPDTEGEMAMKNRFAAGFSATVLAAGIYCLCSPYPCVLYAGSGAEENSIALIRDQGVPIACADSGIFCIDPNTQHMEMIRRAAMACVTSLGNSAAVVDDGTGCRVDTGFTGDYETAMKVYEASKDWYYGNVGYSMDYKRLADGNVRLLLKTEYGTPAQAYKEHLESESKLKEIASHFSGTDSEKATQIFKWVCSHVSYADGATIGRILETEVGCVPDYNGIRATTYTAVMDGMTTCDGFSSMPLALFDLSGIPVAKVQNGQHAYNVALADGHWILYDAASGVCGTPEDLIRRYGDYYRPQRITCGYKAETGNISIRQTKEIETVRVGQKKAACEP